MTVGIATFNCEWRRTGSEDAALIRERVLTGDVHVVCLTETHVDFLANCGGYTVASSPLTEGPSARTRRKVLLWSRSPWADVDEVGPPDIPQARYAAGITDTPAGKLRIIGVVIPYSFAEVRYGEPKRTTWELHLRYLEALGASLPAEPARTVLLGDFNQRVSRKHQPRPVFERLNQTVLRRLPIATAGVLEPVGRQAIDHVCHSPDLKCCGVRTIPNERPNGGRISDHFGVWAEVQAASSLGPVPEAPRAQLAD